MAHEMNNQSMFNRSSSWSDCEGEISSPPLEVSIIKQVLNYFINMFGHCVFNSWCHEDNKSHTWVEHQIVSPVAVNLL